MDYDEILERIRRGAEQNSREYAREQEEADRQRKAWSDMMQNQYRQQANAYARGYWGSAQDPTTSSSSESFYRPQAISYAKSQCIGDDLRLKDRLFRINMSEADKRALVLKLTAKAEEAMKAYGF